MKEWSKQVALLGATLAVSLVVCDLLYRWIVEPEAIVPTRIGIYDDTLGWAMLPSSSAASGATGKEVVYTINSAGQRDDEVATDKPAGTLRIAFLGDSRTFGYGVPIDQHFTQLIEGYFDKVEGLNFGVPGYGVDQELLALRTRGLQYRPDIVVAYVAHFGDHRHVHTNRFGKNKPVFEIMGDSVVARNLPVPDRFAGRGFVRRMDVRLTELSPLDRDVSGPAWRAVKAMLGRSTPVTAAAPAKSPADSAAFEDRLYTLALAILKQMDREASGAGARFVLVTQLPRLHREATQAGILSFDASAALANPRLALPRDLAHINEAGNGILTRELASFLMQQGLIPAAHHIDVTKVGPGAS